MNLFDDKHKNNCNIISNKIIEAALNVHKELGPGLLENTYEICLCYELSKLNLSFRRQVPIKIKYKQIYLEVGFLADIIVEDMVIIEIKSIEKFSPVHFSQLLTYLKLSNKWLDFY